MEEKQVTQDSDQTAATPGLGLAKGIIAIVLGVLWLFIVPLMFFLVWVLLLFLAGPGASPSPGSDLFTAASLIGGVVLGIVVCGLCIWRGILAIRKRKLKRVTRLNFGLWVGFLVVTLSPGLYFLAILLLSSVSSFWAHHADFQVLQSAHPHHRYRQYPADLIPRPQSRHDVTLPPGPRQRASRDWLSSHGAFQRRCSLAEHVRRLPNRQTQPPCPERMEACKTRPSLYRLPRGGEMATEPAVTSDYQNDAEAACGAITASYLLNIAHRNY